MKKREGCLGTGLAGSLRSPSHLLPRPGGGFLPLARTRVHREHNEFALTERCFLFCYVGSFLGIERKGL